MTGEFVPGAATEVVRYEQHLHVRTKRVPRERVVLRRHVVTEKRQIEVTVRREELHVHREPLHDQHATGQRVGSRADRRAAVIGFQPRGPAADRQQLPSQHARRVGVIKPVVARG